MKFYLKTPGKKGNVLDGKYKGWTQIAPISFSMYAGTQDPLHSSLASKGTAYFDDILISVDSSTSAGVAEIAELPAKVESYEIAGVADVDKMEDALVTFKLKALATGASTKGCLLRWVECIIETKNVDEKGKAKSGPKMSICRLKSKVS